MAHAGELEVDVEDGEIIVTKPGTEFLVKKRPDQPWLTTDLISQTCRACWSAFGRAVLASVT
jgi:hypothetical protein